MDNKDRLDDFLRDKFAEAESRMAFRDDHWQQAQALIEASERRRRWFWWLSAGMVLLGLLGWWYVSVDILPRPLAEGLVPKALPASKDGPDRSAKGAVSSAATTYPFPGSPAQQTQLNSMELPKTEVAGNPVLTSPSEINRARLETLAEEEASAATGSVAGPSVVSALLPLVRQEQLSSSLQLLDLPQRPVSLRTFPGFLPPPDRYRDWQWQVAVLLGGASSTGQFQNEKFGLSSGLALQLRKTDARFSLNTALLWRWRSGSVPAQDSVPTVSERLEYSFGYSRRRYEKKMTGTHWLELPIYGRFHGRNWSAEAGVAPAFLLLAQGQIKLTQESSLHGARKVDKQLIRMDQQYLRPFGVSLFTGAQWQVNRQTSLGLRLHFQATTVERPSDLNPPGRRMYWADLRLAYTIF